MKQEITEDLGKKKCLDCIFHRKNAGTHHISCSKRNVLISGSEHGIQQDWFNFPYDFDSIWLEQCLSYRKEGFDLENFSTGDLYLLLTKEIFIFQEVSKFAEKNALFNLLRIERGTRLNKKGLEEDVYPLLKRLKGNKPEDIKEEDRANILKALNLFFYL